MLLWLKRPILVAVILLMMIQMFRPARTNPPIDPRREIGAHLAVDPAVSSLFAQSCNDCHSNRTIWPWYSRVAPASWLVVYDVNRGRKALNFSDWAGYGTEDQRKHLSEICREMSEGEMPGFPYVLLHPHTAVGNADVAAVCRWTSGQAGDSARNE